MNEPAIRERIHHAPFGHVGFVVGSAKAEPAVATDACAPVEPQIGPLWDFLAGHQIPAGQAAAAAICSRLHDLPEKLRLRLERFFVIAGKEPISKSVMKTTLALCEAACPGPNIRSNLITALAEQEAMVWQQRSVHSAFLDMAGEPPESFCLIPDPAELPSLATSWPESDPAMSILVQKAIATSIELASQGKPWLCQWDHDRPHGLWLWSGRSSAGISPMNGGFVFTRHIWAVFASDGAVPSVRESASTSVRSPSGLMMSIAPWSFTERAWSGADDHKVLLHAGVSLESPLWPIVRLRKAAEA